MRHYTRRRAVTATVAMVTVLACGAAAVAAPSTASKHSGIFAGYAVSKPGLAIRQVTATFVVPSITCKNSFSGVGPSVLVYSNVNAKTGSHITSGAGLGVACENGNPFYESVAIVNDNAFNDLTLHAGDVVDVVVRVVPAGTTVRINDVTADVSKVRTGRGRSAVQTFVGDNSVVVDGQGGKLDPFTPTHVTDVLVNNRPLGAVSPIRFQWVRQGTTLVSASTLRIGEDFTLTFRQSG
jgi:hypothetical protein